MTIADISFIIICRARKPRRVGYLDIHGRLSSSPKQEVMMEDRYISDAPGDYRLSIHTLVARGAAAEREEGNSPTKRARLSGFLPGHLNPTEYLSTVDQGCLALHLPPGSS